MLSLPGCVCVCVCNFLNLVLTIQQNFTGFWPCIENSESIELSEAISILGLLCKKGNGEFNRCRGKDLCD